uniref:Uncharacterized protein n=1 Tax=Romanomermis culicivorax TaxID=13658 RepID=A0A915LBK8_ROMCU
MSGGNMRYSFTDRSISRNEICPPRKIGLRSMNHLRACSPSKMMAEHPRACSELCLEMLDEHAQGKFARQAEPLGVCIHKGGGCCNCEVFVSILLTCLLYLPGLIYALYIICSSPSGE